MLTGQLILYETLTTVK